VNGHDPGVVYASEMVALSDDVVNWAESAVGQQVLDWKGLREGGAPWLLRLRGGDQVVLRAGGAFATEVAALRLAEKHRIPAPRLVAVGDGVMLISVVPGSSLIPVEPTTERLEALGAVAARLHAVELLPCHELPARSRPIELEDFRQWRQREGASELLHAAEDAVARLPEPAAGSVFVHGDLWQGNIMWEEDKATAMVDWDCAGVGHPGVDLGSLRCDVAMLFGGDAPEIVLAAWQKHSGRALDDAAYWDMVAALSTPPKMADWESTIQDQGRPDLNGEVLTARRDTFLHNALNRLPGSK
jgi:aminoglycoside phosphotransferase (APT) family kinase protein